MPSSCSHRSCFSSITFWIVQRDGVSALQCIGFSFDDAQADVLPPLLALHSVVVCQLTAGVCIRPTVLLHIIFSSAVGHRLQLDWSGHPFSCGSLGCPAAAKGRSSRYSCRPWSFCRCVASTVAAIAHPQADRTALVGQYLRLLLQGCPTVCS
jgi:hypothetical protein